MQTKSAGLVLHSTKWIAIWATAVIGLTVTVFAQGRVTATDSLTNVVERGDLDALRTRLSSGANPNETDGSVVKGWTPLMEAASSGNVAAARLLLEAGAAIDAKTEYGNTALDVALAAGKAHVAELLRCASTAGLRNCSDAGVDSDPSPATVAPTQWPSASTVAHLRFILVDSRVEAETVVEKLKGGQSFADLARRYSTDSTKDVGGTFIIEVGALREEFKTALNGVRPGGTTEIVELVNKGRRNTFALIHCDYIEGPLDKPLLEAAETGGPTVQQLLQHGANFNVVDESGRTPLIRAALAGHAAAVKALLAAKANGDAADNDGLTALYGASQNGHADVVTLLLADKPKVNTTIKNTALISASQNGHADVVKLLLASGANVNASASATVVTGQSLSLTLRTDVSTAVIGGVTGLMRASENGHADVVRLLLTSGARVNASATNGATALMFASKSGRADIVKLLLASGANVNAVAKSGATALQLASQGDDVIAVGNVGVKLSGGPSKGYADTVRLLKAAGAK